jgi:hypothetical protein
MANNRLYIVDTATGDKFMLAKSCTGEWNPPSVPLADDLEKWLRGRDGIAAIGGHYSALRLVTENGTNINCNRNADRDKSPDVRIKDMLREVAQIGRSGSYAERSCAANRARDLLAEIDGMQKVDASELLRADNG